jgi:hypothetical protein
MKPKKLIGAGGALVAGALAFGLPGAPVAAEGEGQHNEVHEEQVTITDYDHISHTCYVYYGTSLNSQDRRYESWIFAEGDNAACYGASASVTVDYVRQDGGEGSYIAFGHGSFAQSIVFDVKEPYESRSYSARHILFWNSCQCQVTRTTSPK